MTASTSGSFDNFFRDVPKAINVDVIRNAWLALDNAYDIETWQLPMPLWARRVYTDSGDRAWQTLQQDLLDANPKQPLCIYIHVPFCSRKCGFCDSYSFKLGNYKSQHIEKYLVHLRNELRLWSTMGNLDHRSISTIHLGGGTPTFLGESALENLVDCCRENFAITPTTEWALESTVNDLPPAMINCLHRLGFRRLHIGIQSLQDQVRTIIGRFCSSAEALKLIESTLGRSWIVSADLLYGLPDQTFKEFIQGIERLIATGINGISLYELIIRQQNYRWSNRYNLTRRSHLLNYFFLQTGAFILESNGFHKNFYNHWSDTQDKNVYFTFPMRDEDCLAIGASADGCFGDYHYRHPLYMDYLLFNHSALPGLEGGMRKNELERRLHHFETAIFSGYISLDMMKKLDNFSIGNSSLTQRWIKHEMIKFASDGGAYLMANGTWFAGNMINELKSCLQFS